MSAWTRQPITVKLPATLAALLLAATAAMAAASYYEMRRSVVSIGSERLEQAAAQMANVLAGSARQRIALHSQLIEHPAIVAYLRAATPDTAKAATEVMLAHLGATAEIGNLELWDPAGRRLLQAGLDLEPSASNALRAEFDAAAAPVVGSLRLVGQRLMYEVGGRATDAGAPLGYVVERRRIANPAQTQQTLALLTGFIGGQASIVLGNADGSAWTDLTQPVAAVPIDAADPERLFTYQRGTRPPVFARGHVIAGTPWVVVVEFPQDVVLAPTRPLLRLIMLIGLTVVAIAALAGWWLSRMITQPLLQVTEAAEAVARSRPSVYVELSRHDELGRLADSFNTMAIEVERGRHELEERVEARTAALAAANADLEAFSYSVSHDLRAPLRAISGFVQILKDDHGAVLPPDGLQALDVIQRNAIRMGKLIDDLLDFSRLSRAPLGMARLDMARLVRGVVDEAQRAAGHPPVTVDIGALPDAAGEAAMIEQVWLNLVQNAIKFSSGREHPRVTIGALPEPAEVATYFIRDNGVGFDMRYADKLFGVFERLHQAHEFPGTGVGLAIAHRIVTRQGGRIWAESVVGEGATFWFTLPRGPLPELVSPAAAGHHQPSA